MFVGCGCLQATVEGCQVLYKMLATWIEGLIDFLPSMKASQIDTAWPTSPHPTHPFFFFFFKLKLWCETRVENKLHTWIILYFTEHSLLNLLQRNFVVALGKKKCSLTIAPRAVVLSGSVGELVGLTSLWMNFQSPDFNTHNCNEKSHLPWNRRQLEECKFARGSQNHLTIQVQKGWWVCFFFSPVVYHCINCVYGKPPAKKCHRSYQ